MKTKIIALLLLVTLCVSLLTGCAFNYQKEDLSEYATVDATALYNALKKLQIADGDFTNGVGDNAQIRTDKTLLSFAQSIVSSIKGDEDRQMKEGTVGAGDYITYCYYKVANNSTTDKKEYYVLSAEYMQKSKAVALLLQGNEKDTLDAKIESALMGFDVAGLYKETTTGDLPTTGWALVSLSYNVGTNGSKKTASYVLLDLGGNNHTEAENELIAAIKAHSKAKIGTKFATGATDKADTTDVDETDAKIEIVNGDVTTYYYDITVKSVISGTRLFNQTDDKATPIVEAPYADTEKYTQEELLNVSLKDMYGNSVPVKNETMIEYYIFPVTAYDIEALDESNKEGAVREILFSIYKSGLTIESLKAFKNAELAYKETVEGTEKTVKLEAVIAELIAARANVTKAESALTAAESALKAAESALEKATEEEKEAKQEAVDTAKKAVDDAKIDLEKKKAEIDPDTVMEKIAKCKKDDTTTAIGEIYKEYYDALYNKLEDEYENEILEHINEAIGKLLKESVKHTDKLPEKAVNEAYKRNLKAYRYQYFTGKNGTDTNAKPYTELYENLDEFLCKKVAKDITGKEAATAKDAKAAVRTEAEAQVKETIAVYVLAEALNSKFEDADLTLEKSAAKDYASLQAYVYNQQVDAYYDYLSSLIGTTYTAPASEYRTADYYLQYYGETSLRTAYLADPIMAFLTENEDEGEDEENPSILDFTNIGYEIKEDTADEGDGE